MVMGNGLYFSCTLSFPFCVGGAGGGGGKGDSYFSSPFLCLKGKQIKCYTKYTLKTIRTCYFYAVSQLLRRIIAKGEVAPSKRCSCTRPDSPRLVLGACLCWLQLRT